MSGRNELSISATGSPPPAFPDVGALLWRRELWRDWLAEHPQEADLLAETYGSLVRLTAHTGWTEDRTLARLGCAANSEDELRKLATERLGLCCEYFGWVERLLPGLDLASDKRLMVSGGARLFAAADHDLRRCEGAMRAGAFPAREYLRLGEIAQSWQQAIRHLDGPRAGRARTVEGENPFADESMPHLSVRRMTMLAGPEASRLLGPRVAHLMREHVRICPACEDAFRAQHPDRRRESRRAAVPA